MMNKIAATSAIEMGKTYKTRSGESVRVLCVDAPDADYPVIALRVDASLLRLTKDGCFYYQSCMECENDLIEHNPWSDVPVDTKILVSMGAADPWHPAHFAQFTNDAVYAWADGKTSHTTGSIRRYNCAKIGEKFEEFDM